MNAHVIAVSGAASNIGMRSINEDSYLAQSPVFIVADGMGGHRSGDVASRTVTNEFRSFVGKPFVSGPELEACMLRCSAKVAALASPRGVPGTTLTGMVLCEMGGYPYARVFNVGDSRTYHLSGPSFTQVTKDHSEVQTLIDSGQLTEDEARTSSRRHVITRAFGASSRNVGADYHLIPLNVGDRFLMCSDGLSGMVPILEIGEVARYMNDPKETAQTLVQKALGAGGSDNVTVVVVDIIECSPQLGKAAEDETVTAGRRHASDDTVPRRG